MKTILFVIVLLAWAFQVEAEQVFVSEKTREVMVVPDGYKPATPIQLQVRSDPGAKAPIFETRMKRLDFFHVVEQHVSEEVLVFQDGKFEKIKERSEITGEPSFLGNIPIIFLSILLMFISNFGKVKGSFKLAYVFAFAAGFVIFGSGGIAVQVNSASCSGYFGIIDASIAVITGLYSDSKIKYWAFSIAFYILATLALFV